jgi:hypothetical protein
MVSHSTRMSSSETSGSVCIYSPPSSTHCCVGAKCLNCLGKSRPTVAPWWKVQTTILPQAITARSMYPMNWRLRTSDFDSYHKFRVSLAHPPPPKPVPQTPRFGRNASGLPRPPFPTSRQNPLSRFSPYADDGGSTLRAGSTGTPFTNSPAQSDHTQ